jgi:hypothetical protein
MINTQLQLTIEDMDRLHAQFPELIFSVSGPDLDTITQFFLVKSVTGTLKIEDKEETADLEDRLVSLGIIFMLSLEISALHANVKPAVNIMWF